MGTVDCVTRFMNYDCWLEQSPVHCSFFHSSVHRSQARTPIGENRSTRNGTRSQDDLMFRRMGLINYGRICQCFVVCLIQLIRYPSKRSRAITGMHSWRPLWALNATHFSHFSHSLFPPHSKKSSVPQNWRTFTGDGSQKVHSIPSFICETRNISVLCNHAVVARGASSSSH